MDGDRFDTLSRLLGQGGNRRAAFAALAALAAGGMEDVAAKHQRHNNNKHQRHQHPQAKPPGAGCSKENQPCGPTAPCCGNLLCDATTNRCAKPTPPGQCGANELKCRGTCCAAPSNATPRCDSQGNCGFACDAGYQPCDGACVERSTLCGGVCGNVCNPANGEACVSGACTIVAGTCTAAQAALTCQEPAEIVPKCNGGTNCRCFTTTSGVLFCASLFGTVCANCSSDDDCAEFGPNRLCVVADGPECCSVGGTRACAPPCDTQ
jgi:hypothetical protein